MQKLLKWFTPIFSVGVAIFIVFFLLSVNSEEKYIKKEHLTLPEQKRQIKEDNSWLKNFSDTYKSGYSYPINEIFIKVDLNEKITKTITYKLSAPLLDPYQLFCLKEELKYRRFKYDLKKNKEEVELVIYSKNKKS